jgi:hypothetical protein
MVKESFNNNSSCSRNQTLTKCSSLNKIGRKAIHLMSSEVETLMLSNLICKLPTINKASIYKEWMIWKIRIYLTNLFREYQVLQGTSSNKIIMANLKCLIQDPWVTSKSKLSIKILACIHLNAKSSYSKRKLISP